MITLVAEPGAIVRRKDLAAKVVLHLDKDPFAILAEFTGQSIERIMLDWQSQSRAGCHAPQTPLWRVTRLPEATSAACSASVV